MQQSQQRVTVPLIAATFLSNKGYYYKTLPKNARSVMHTCLDAYGKRKSIRQARVAIELPIQENEPLKYDGNIVGFIVIQLFICLS